VNTGTLIVAGEPGVGNSPIQVVVSVPGPEAWAIYLPAALQRK
jgi:hypothetical protein